METFAFVCLTSQQMSTLLYLKCFGTWQFKNATTGAGIEQVGAFGTPEQTLAPKGVIVDEGGGEAKVKDPDVELRTVMFNKAMARPKLAPIKLLDQYFVFDEAEGGGFSPGKLAQPWIIQWSVAPWGLRRRTRTD